MNPSGQTTTSPILTVHEAPGEQHRPQRPSTHPLAPLVLGLFAQESTLDVAIVTVALMGCTFLSPAKGNRAYRIVAADVLGCLWDAGHLVRHGTANPCCPERGGWYYTRPVTNNTEEQAA
jgi:hypothetical protein